jgi:formate hydrogenlyase transcriptional activator
MVDREKADTQNDHPGDQKDNQYRDDAAAGLLLKINNAVVSVLDLRELLNVISVCLRQTVRHDFAALILYDAEKHQLRAHALDFDNRGEAVEEGVLFPIEGTPSGMAFTTRQTLIVNPRELENFAATPLIQMLRAEGVQSGCSVPLILHNRVLGVLSLMSLSENTFTESIARLLEDVAGQLAIAVDNALNHQQIKYARDRFELLLEISNTISSTLNFRELLKKTSTILRRNINHDFAGIAIFDEEKQMLQVLEMNNPPDFIEEGYLIPLEGTADGLAFSTKQIVLRDRIDSTEFYAPQIRPVFEAGITSVCVVPLMARDRVFGVLAVAAKEEAAFNKSDGEILQLFANQIAAAVENALQYAEIEKLKNKLAGEKLYLEEEIQSQYNFAEIIGNSRALKQVLREIETVAPTNSCVLICGESGTGKELIARAIHNLSNRRERTMVKLNCSAIPTGLLESELFGHEKGAFTGAIAQRIGRFELAHKGTLLLDEIGDIPLELQPKLLRVLQESEFERLGNSRTQKVDVRLIAATNCDLPAMVAEKKFRGDLYYRLNVFPVTIPPLRERREDIPLLAAYFVQKHAHRMSKTIKSISQESLAALCEYDYPGNVRELENFIERAVILTHGKKLELSLSALKTNERIDNQDISEVKKNSLLASLEDVERTHIEKVLKQTRGVIGGKGGAAEIVGLPVSTLRHRMKKLGIK